MSDTQSNGHHPPQGPTLPQPVTFTALVDVKRVGSKSYVVLSFAHHTGLTVLHMEPAAAELFAKTVAAAVVRARSGLVVPPGGPAAP